MARITKVSPVSNKTRTVEFSKYTQDEFEIRLLAWKNGQCELEECLPDISPAGRYFISTGIWVDEYEEKFSKQDE